MTVRLHVEFKTVNWETFLKEYPVRSISLDGHVSEGPLFDHEMKKANFNHHEGVNRLATRSTCSQVRMAILSNLFDSFRQGDGELDFDVFVNDADEDVCTSWYLLNNGHMSEIALNPLISRLIFCEDALDTTSGAYPFPKDMQMLREMAWVFEPYRRARVNGILDIKKEDVYKGIIEDVEGRIKQYVAGNGGKIALDTNYKIIGGGKGWNMVEEVGPYAKTGMFADKIKAYVSVRERNDGKFQYVIGKSSPFVSTFDLPKLFATLNQIEGQGTEIWGGGDVVGGSPRVNGSSITPEEMTKIINDHVEKR